MNPTVPSPQGIFGDPQLFVFESRDDDSETRNFGPMFFNVRWEPRDWGMGANVVTPSFPPHCNQLPTES